MFSDQFSTAIESQAICDKCRKLMLTQQTKCTENYVSPTYYYLLLALQAQGATGVQKQLYVDLYTNTTRVSPSDKCKL